MEGTARVTLFEDIFEVTALNPDSYKFERVNRLQATGTTFECELLLDINCEIYHLKEYDKFTLVLASTLPLGDNGISDTGTIRDGRSSGDSLLFNAARTALSQRWCSSAVTGCRSYSSSSAGTTSSSTSLCASCKAAAEV